MWPRTDVPTAATMDLAGSRRPKALGLNGFVSFMTRRDAEEALRQFDGFDWGGFVLRVGWSKAVPISAKPLYGIALDMHNINLRLTHPPCHSFYVE